jgi:hypothetical protein
MVLPAPIHFKKKGKNGYLLPCLKETELEPEPDRPPIMEQGKGDITNYLSNYDNKINCTLTNCYQKSNIDYVSSQVCARYIFKRVSETVEEW